MSDPEQSEDLYKKKCWYWLATVHGEQPTKTAFDNEPEEPDEADRVKLARYKRTNERRELANKNRELWNRWMTAAITSGQCTELIKKGLPASNCKPFCGYEEVKFVDEFKKRAEADGCSGNIKPPSPREKVDFSGLEFERDVSFRGFVFPTETDFSGAKFRYNADFRKAAFFGRVLFKRTEFFGLAWFRMVEFRSRTSFKDANFVDSVPDFRDATLPEVTEFHDVRWPKILAPRYGCRLRPKSKDEARDAVSAYERLKAEMARLRKYEDEEIFFAKELRMRRELYWDDKWYDTKKRFSLCERMRFAFLWWVNWGYECVSGYGQSIVRPVIWLGALFLISGILFAVATGRPLDCMLFSLTKSLASIFSFLPITRETLRQLRGIEFFISVGESVFSIVLFFLLILALRNRFRMR